MLRGAGQSFHAARFGTRQRDGDHGGGKPLDGGGDGLCSVRAGLRVTAFYLIACLHLIIDVVGISLFEFRLIKDVLQATN